MAIAYRKAAEFPDRIPVFPLSGALLLPRAPLPLNIFEPRYLNMVDDALIGDRLIGMVQTVAGGAPETPALAPVGCVGRLTSYSETSDGRYLITLSGLCRYVIKGEAKTNLPYRMADVDFAPFEHDLSSPNMASFDRAAFLETLSGYLRAHDLDAEWEALDNAPPEILVNSLAMICPFSAAEKQALLEAETVASRLDTLTALMKIESASSANNGSTGLQ